MKRGSRLQKGVWIEIKFHFPKKWFIRRRTIGYELAETFGKKSDEFWLKKNGKNSFMINFLEGVKK